MTEARRPKVVLLGPVLNAVSGVSTHLKLMLESELASQFELLHFQVGSEGRQESTANKLLRFLTGPLALARFIRRQRSDLLHINTSFDPKGFWRDLAFLIAGKALGQRIVYQVHGSVYPEDFMAGNPLTSWILRRTLLACDVVCVLSEAELPSYRRFDPRINVRLIANAIDARELIRHPRTPNRDAPLRLCYLGRLIAAKGVIESVQACALLRDQGRKISLDIAGGGPDEALLLAEIHRLDIAGSVRFLGAKFGPEKDRLWLESDLFVFPTYHLEGIPYSILESMAAGCVPLTSNVGGIPDVVRDGQEGLIVATRNAQALADAIARLDDDREELARMSRAGRERIIRSYSIERLSDAFNQLYRQAIAGKWRTTAIATSESTH